MQDWIKEGLPQEPGDYLWVAMWGCNCCVRQNGIAWIKTVEGVTSTDPKDTEWNGSPPDHLYKNKAGQVMELNFGKEKPYYSEEVKEWDVDGWLKLELPNCREN